MSTNSNGNGKKPVFHTKCDSVTVAVWANDGQYPGRPMYSAQVQRTYTTVDEVTGELTYHNTDSIPLNQMLAASAALHLAYIRVQNLKQQAAARPAAQPAGGTRRPASNPPAAGNDDSGSQPAEGMTKVRMPNGQVLSVPAAVAAHMKTLQERVANQDADYDAKAETAAAGEVAY
jgi:hypothetical protein